MPNIWNDTMFGDLDLTSKCIARVCQNQLSFLFLGSIKRLSFQLSCSVSCQQIQFFVKIDLASSSDMINCKVK